MHLIRANGTAIRSRPGQRRRDPDQSSGNRVIVLRSRAGVHRAFSSFDSVAMAVVGAGYVVSVVDGILLRISWMEEEVRMFEIRRIFLVMATAVLVIGAAGAGASAATNKASAASNGLAAGARGFGVSVVDPVCKVVLDANHKTLDTANHMYTDRPGGDGKRTTGEMITANGERYIQVRGAWRKSPMTIAATKAQEEENIKDAKVLSCKRVGDDTVNGEAATVYTEHTENEETKSDGKIWISKSRGLILKEEIDLDSGDAGKQHVGIRYEYGNVKAPI